MATTGPEVQDRPPDPTKNNTEQTLHHLTQQNPKQIILQETPADTDQSPQAKTISGHNQIVLKPQIDSSSQLTTTQAKSIIPTQRIHDVKNAVEIHEGVNGAQSKRPFLNGPQTVNNNYPELFPKLTSNFDKSTRRNYQAQNLNPLSNKVHSTPPVRLNASANMDSSRHKEVTTDNLKVTPPPPHIVKPTFANTLRSINEHAIPRIEISRAKQTSKQGYPAIIFKRDDYLVKLAARCKFTLVGKFDSTMPRMDVIRRCFETQVQLKGPVKIAHFNANHVYIDLTNQLDHDTVWFKHTIWIQGRAMKLFTWTPTFKPTQETPIAPIWVVLPELPWHMYYMEAVTELLLSVGRVISLDTATFQKTRGSVAKIKLEVDVTRPRPKYLWVGFDEDENGDGYWQEVQYEDVPDYCTYCKHQGHLFEVCAIKRRDEEMDKEKFADRPDVTGSKQHQKRGPPPAKTPLQPSQLTTQQIKFNDAQRKKADTGKPSLPRQQYVAKQNDTQEVKRTAAENVVSHNLVSHTLVGKSVKAGAVKFTSPENQSTVANTKNSFDVLNEIETEEATDIATGSTVKKTPEQAAQNNISATVAIDNHDLNAHEPDLSTSDNAIENMVRKEEIAASGNLQDRNQILEINEVDKGGTLMEIPVQPVQNSKMALAPEKSVVASADIPGKILGMSTLVGSTTNMCVQVPNEDPIVAESTKSWVQRSFGKSGNALQNTVADDTQYETGIAPDVVATTIPYLEQTAPTVEKNLAEIPTDHQEQIQHTSAAGGKSDKNTSTTGKKTRKKHGKNADATGEKAKTEKSTQEVLQQTEEEALKARIRAWQDAILAKSYAENPVKESNEEPLNVLENKAADLTPTPQLVEICKATTRLKNIPRQLHSKSKKTINSTISMNVEDGNDLETYFIGDIFSEAQHGDKAPSEPETYFLGDIFSDAQHGDNTPKVDGEKVYTQYTSGKHKWNVNATEFVPKALPQVGLCALQDDSESDESKVSLPEDGVLLERMDLYDKKGLLKRQNTPQKDLPSKISIVPPGFVDSDPEYEDEDEFSIAHNEMHAARIGALSPRVEEIKRPKNIIRKRAPLERRTQPSRSSKMKSTRSNDYVW